jgi:hypothetical protein
MKRIIFISILLTVGLVANAQCNNTLVEKAKSEITKNEIPKQSFQVELEEASIKDPSPAARFSLPLEKETKYRLRIVNDTIKYNSTGIIKLYDDDRLLGISYANQTDTCYPFFDFKCTTKGVFHLFITFKDGKAGCAVVVVSEVK